MIQETREKSTSDVEMILVGNKIDLISEKVFKLDGIKEFANKYNIDAYETSAKNGKGVENIFLKYLKSYLKTKKK